MYAAALFLETGTEDQYIGVGARGQGSGGVTLRALRGGVKDLPLGEGWRRSGGEDWGLGARGDGSRGRG